MGPPNPSGPAAPEPGAGQFGPGTDTAGDHSLGAWARAGSIGLGLSLAIFLFYFAVYPIRHLSLPQGFDPPWYVWRAQDVAALGTAAAQVSARPGHPILSAVAGSLTRVSQLELVVVMSLVFVPMLALAVGAFCRTGLGFGRGEWIVAVAACGVVVGPTHLVGENLSTILFLALVVVALVPLVNRIGGRRGFWPTVALLAASGVVHWEFLAVFGLVLATAFLLALPASRRQGMLAVASGETETGILVRIGASVGVILAVLPLGILRASLWAAGILQDPSLYLTKFHTDITRLAIPGPVGLIAAPLVRTLRPPIVPMRDRGTLVAEARALEVVRDDAAGGEAVSTEGPARSSSLRILDAWTYVMAGGMVFGLLTTKVPPARFLDMLVALPGSIGVATVVLFIARLAARRVRSRRRVGRASITASAVIALSIAGLAIPGALRWYKYPVVMNGTWLQEAETASRYVQMLPAHQPVIFLVGYRGVPRVYESVVKERTIRIALPPDRKLDASIYVGTPVNLLAGRRTPPPDVRTDRATLPSWEDVRSVLAGRPPILILRSMAEDEFSQAHGLGAVVIGPGVELLRGPRPARLLAKATSPHPVPGLAEGILVALSILLLFGAAGVGWTRLWLGPGRSIEVTVSMAPTVGAAVLILGGLMADKAGVRLGGDGGVAVYVGVTLVGFALASIDGRRRARRIRPRGDSAPPDRTA